MAWAIPNFKQQDVNAAGKLLSQSSSEEFDFFLEENFDRYMHALHVANDWRSAHAYPLNTFQVYLRGVARRFEANPLVAQRVKRLASIQSKLSRFPSMRLTQMQDLGGCRAILGSINNVQAVRNYYESVSAIKHEMQSAVDYIAEPKASGYRGIHLIYKYQSDRIAKAMYNGLKIEVQLRSKNFNMLGRQQWRPLVCSLVKH